MTSADARLHVTNGQYGQGADAAPLAVNGQGEQTYGYGQAVGAPLHTANAHDGDAHGQVTSADARLHVTNGQYGQSAGAHPHTANMHTSDEQGLASEAYKYSPPTDLHVLAAGQYDRAADEYGSGNAEGTSMYANNK